MTGETFQPATTMSPPTTSPSSMKKDLLIGLLPEYEMPAPDDENQAILSVEELRGSAARMETAARTETGPTRAQLLRTARGFRWLATYREKRGIVPTRLQASPEPPAAQQAE